jgi:hypothetical protein
MFRRWPIGKEQAALGASILLVLAGAQAGSAEDAIDARMRKDVNFLASDECEGRGVTTQGINKAADYIAAEFREAGLKPAGPGHSYFQPFSMAGAVLLSPNTMRFRGPHGAEVRLKLGEQFQPLGLSYPGKVSAPLVFAGYGVTTDEYDDFQSIDVAGKVVILLRDLPHVSNRFGSYDRRGRLASLKEKIMNAEKHGAAAVIFVNDRRMAEGGDDLLNFGFTAIGGSPAKLPVVQVRRSVIDEVLRSSLNTDLGAIEEQITKNFLPASATLTDWTVDLQVSVSRSGLPVKNVAGLLEGAGPLAHETVILGAHYDHLGYGGSGSLAKSTKPAIHHGADDNASGTTTLIELARRFGRMSNRQGRRLLFLAFSGEESGLLGSEHYCKHPLFPLSDTVAMVNMDMVGRLRPDKKGPWSAFLAMLAPEAEGGLPAILSVTAFSKADVSGSLAFRDKMTVYGTGTSKNFAQLLEGVNKKYGFKLQKTSGISGDSDHASFYARKIPVFFFFTEDHEDYHRPSDTADKINVPGMHRIGDLVEDLAIQLAQAPERPQYVKISSQARDPGRFAGMPRLGFRPGNYGEEDGGVLVGGVLDGGAAAKAGIKDGDRIIAIGGKAVKNMAAYMSVMSAQQKGKPLEISLQRGGQNLTLTVTPD